MNPYFSQLSLKSLFGTVPGTVVVANVVVVLVKDFRFFLGRCSTSIISGFRVTGKSFNIGAKFANGLKLKPLTGMDSTGFITFDDFSVLNPLLIQLDAFRRNFFSLSNFSQKSASSREMFVMAKIQQVLI